jgi:hypothetical protein
MKSEMEISVVDSKEKQLIVLLMQCVSMERGHNTTF